MEFPSVSRYEVTLYRGSRESERTRYKGAILVEACCYAANGGDAARIVAQDSGVEWDIADCERLDD